MTDDRPKSEKMAAHIRESHWKVLRRVHPMVGEHMVQRYAHLAAEHLSIYAGNLEIHGTNMAQSGEYPRVAPRGRAYIVESIDENWCRLRDLNPRPTVYKTAALPLS